MDQAKHPHPDPQAASRAAAASPDVPPEPVEGLGIAYELYLDFVGGTPQTGQPAGLKARALTGNFHAHTGFVLDADVPFQGGMADTLYTTLNWSYAEGTVTFLEAGDCRLKVGFQLVFADGSFRIIDRVLSFYVMR